MGPFLFGELWNSFVWETKMYPPLRVIIYVFLLFQSAVILISSAYLQFPAWWNVSFPCRTRRWRWHLQPSNHLENLKIVLATASMTKTAEVKGMNESAFAQEEMCALSTAESVLLLSSSPLRSFCPSNFAIITVKRGINISRKRWRYSHFHEKCLLMDQVLAPPEGPQPRHFGNTSSKSNQN